LSSGFVVDASVGFSWVYQSQATNDTDALLNDVVSGAAVVVPTLWFFEIANVLLIAERRKKLTAAQRKAALKSLEALTLNIDEEGHRSAFRKTSEISDKYGLSIYDGTYLELALRRKLPIASRDEPLRAAAKKAGVDVL